VAGSLQQNKNQLRIEDCTPIRRNAD